LRRRADSGFTLVEVLVALTVVALTIPALLFTLNQQIDGTAYLRDRSLARIVAVNRLAELRLAMRGGRPLLRGSVAGEEEMAGRRWYWSIASENTDIPQLYRVSVRVSDSQEEGVTPLFTLVSLLPGSDDDAATGG
jgi:general secretion pathway protein I